MNKLDHILYTDLQEAIKRSKGNDDKVNEYLCEGSIIAFVRDHRGCFELHGPVTAQLYVLAQCIKQLSKDSDLYTDEILDFLEEGLNHIG